MSDENEIIEQTPTESSEEIIENLWDKFNEKTNPRPLESPLVEEDTVNASTEGASLAPSEPQQEVNWEKRAVTAEKRYDDLQSDWDRRFNKREEQLEARWTAKIEGILAAMGRNGQPAPPPDTFYEAAQDEQRLRKYFDNLLNQKVDDKLSKHPGVAAGNATLEAAKFQQDHPDHMQYFTVMEPALKWFPAAPGESSYDRLSRALGFAQDLYAKAASAAKATEGAVRANTSPTTPQPNGRVTGDQRQQLAARAKQYANEQGVSVAASTKPNIDPYDPRKLRQNILALVTSDEK